MAIPITKAQRRTIQIGDTSLQVVMLPDGDYWLSRIDVSRAIAEPDDSLINFCQGRDDISFEVFKIENQSEPFIAVTIDIACLYWFERAMQGNIAARNISLNLIRHLSSSTNTIH